MLTFCKTRICQKMTSTKTGNPFLDFKRSVRAWGDDSDDEELENSVKPVQEPVKSVQETVKPKTWAKLPQFQAVQVQAIQVEQVQVKQVQPSKPCKVYAVSTQNVSNQNVSNGNRTLMVKNLPRDSTVEKLAIDLRSLFVIHGPIKDVYIPVNREGQYAGTIKGFAKLQFHNADHAAKAIVHAVTKPITIRKNKLFIEYANQDR